MYSPSPQAAFLEVRNKKFYSTKSSSGYSLIFRIILFRKNVYWLVIKRLGWKKKKIAQPVLIDRVIESNKGHKRYHFIICEEKIFKISVQHIKLNYTLFYTLVLAIKWNFGWAMSMSWELRWFWFNRRLLWGIPAFAPSSYRGRLGIIACILVPIELPVNWWTWVGM